jgi:hypothetical protein
MSYSRRDTLKPDFRFPLRCPSATN